MGGPYIIPPTRYSKVPWLWATDLEEGRDPLWTVGHNEETHSAWRVDLYERDLFPEIECLALVIHATRGDGNDGGVITLSIRTMGVTDEQTKMDMSKLSRRPSASESDPA